MTRRPEHFEDSWTGPIRAALLSWPLRPLLPGLDGIAPAERGAPDGQWPNRQWPNWRDLRSFVHRLARASDLSGHVARLVPEVAELRALVGNLRDAVRWDRVRDCEDRAMGRLARYFEGWTARHFDASRALLAEAPWLTAGGMWMVLSRTGATEGIGAPSEESVRLFRAAAFGPGYNGIQWARLRRSPDDWVLAIVGSCPGGGTQCCCRVRGDDGVLPEHDLACTCAIAVVLQCTKSQPPRALGFRRLERCPHRTMATQQEVRRAQDQALASAFHEALVSQARLHHSIPGNAHAHTIVVPRRLFLADDAPPSIRVVCREVGVQIISGWPPPSGVVPAAPVGHHPKTGTSTDLTDWAAQVTGIGPAWAQDLNLRPAGEIDGFVEDVLRRCCGSEPRQAWVRHVMWVTQRGVSRLGSCRYPYAEITAYHPLLRHLVPAWEGRVLAGSEVTCGGAPFREVSTSVPALAHWEGERVWVRPWHAEPSLAYVYVSEAVQGSLRRADAPDARTAEEDCIACVALDRRYV